MVVVGINDCVFHGRIAYACDPRANAAYHCARTSELGWGLRAWHDSSKNFFAVWLSVHH
jgi:hypothetical protein